MKKKSLNPARKQRAPRNDEIAFNWHYESSKGNKNDLRYRFEFAKLQTHSNQLQDNKKKYSGTNQLTMCWRLSQ